MTGGLSKNFHGVGIGPLSKILAVKSFHNKNSVCRVLPISFLINFHFDFSLIFSADYQANLSRHQLRNNNEKKILEQKLCKSLFHDSVSVKIKTNMKF